MKILFYAITELSRYRILFDPRPDNNNSDFSVLLGLCRRQSKCGSADGNLFQKGRKQCG